MTGAELKAARVRAGLTQDKLARIVGVTGNAIRKLEGGTRAINVMGAEKFVRLAHALGLDPAAMVGEAGTEDRIMIDLTLRPDEHTQALMGAADQAIADRELPAAELNSACAAAADALTAQMSDLERSIFSALGAGNGRDAASYETAKSLIGATLMNEPQFLDFMDAENHGAFEIIEDAMDLPDIAPDEEFYLIRWNVVEPVIGVRFRNVLNMTGQTPEAFAAGYGIPPVEVKKLQNDQRDPARMPALNAYQLAQILGVSVKTVAILAQAAAEVDELEQLGRERLTGADDAAQNYETCIGSGLGSTIRLDCGTGEVWATETVSPDDTITYDDPDIVDITADVAESRDARLRDGLEPPALPDLVRWIAVRTLIDHGKITED